MRKIKQIAEAEREMMDKVWYDRHQMCMESIYPKEKDPEVRKNYEEGDKHAKEMEEKFGKSNLGPYTEFEWGMLNGKLSTLRWVMGEDWDILDT